MVAWGIAALVMGKGFGKYTGTGTEGKGQGTDSKTLEKPVPLSRVRHQQKGRSLVSDCRHYIQVTITITILHSVIFKYICL